MAHLIFRCCSVNRVITTGVHVDPEVFGRLNSERAIRCRFCGNDHAWEIIDQIPEVAALMSTRAEDFLGRAVEDEAFAATATHPAIRELYLRTALRWFNLAIEYEARLEKLSDH